MKRKMFIAVMALALAFTSVIPAGQVGAASVSRSGNFMDADDDEDDVDDGEEIDGDEPSDDDDEFSGEFTKYDIRTSPAKKTIRIGKSFSIKIRPEDESEWEDYTDEEWDEICDKNIDDIRYRSTKSSVAYVNEKTGKVKAKRKGTADIKTYVSLANGETAIYKTKVYVIK